MKIQYDNKLIDLTVTSSSEDSPEVKENALDPRQMVVFSFTGKTSEWIMFDAGSGNTINWDTVCIGGHNLTSGSVVEVQANATDSWGTPSVDVTLTWYEWIMSYQAATTQQYRYLRITFVDTGNTENIKVGNISAGSVYDSPDISPNTLIEKVFNGRVQYQRVEFAYPIVENAIRKTFNDVLEFIGGTIQLSLTRQQYGDAIPVYLFIWDEDLTIENVIYGLIVDSGHWIRPVSQGKKWATGNVLEEVF